MSGRLKMLSFLKKRKNHGKVISAMNIVRDKFCKDCKADVIKHKCLRLNKLCPECKELIQGWLK